MQWQIGICVVTLIFPHVMLLGIEHVSASWKQANMSLGIPVYGHQWVPLYTWLH